MKFTAEWKQLTEEMGYFVDMEHPYITYDNKYGKERKDSNLGASNQETAENFKKENIFLDVR